MDFCRELKGEKTGVVNNVTDIGDINFKQRAISRERRMDDIDDLLNEVESKYCNNAKSKEEIRKPVETTKRCSKTLEDDSLNDIINDIISDDTYRKPLSKSCVSRAKHHSPSTSIAGDSYTPTKTKVKCFVIYVAGAKTKPGYSSSVQQNPCDQLHCTSCDNKIVAFDNFKWNDHDCSYLVFRNNYPDFLRLKQFLINNPGYRAYCCQCSWLSVNGVSELRLVKPAFKWICKKH